MSSRRRHLTPWLLIASLLFGLWTAAGHPEHGGPAPAHADACAVCAFAGGLGAGLAAAAIALALFALAPLRLATAVPPTRPAPRRFVFARGPPSHLA